MWKLMENREKKFYYVIKPWRIKVGVESEMRVYSSLFGGNRVVGLEFWYRIRVDMLI